MKKIFAVLVLAILIILTTGCYKGNVAIVVQEDGSADVQITARAIPFVADVMAEHIKALESQGYTVEKVRDGEVIGYKAQKHYDSFTGISSMSMFQGKNPGVPGMLMRRGWFYDVYEIQVLSTIKNNTKDTPTVQEKEMIQKMVSMDVTVTLPTKVSQHNGKLATMEGKTIEWQLDILGETLLQAEATRWKWSNILLTLLLAIGGFAFSFVRKQYHPLVVALLLSGVVSACGSIYYWHLNDRDKATIGVADTKSASPVNTSVTAPPAVKKNELASQLEQYVSIASVKKQFREKWGNGSSIGDYVVFILSIQNKSSRDIDTVNGTLVFRDRSGEAIYSFVASNNGEIRAGQSQLFHHFLKFDEKNARHVRLKNAQISEFTMEWIPKEVVLSDGTRIGSLGQSNPPAAAGLDIEIPEKQNIFPPIFMKTVKGKNGLVNLYASPNTYAAVIGTIKENTEFKGMHGKNGFLFVNVNGVKGWVKRENADSAI